MEFPGMNEMKFGAESATKLVEAILKEQLAAPNLRVTRVRANYDGMEVSFTTDPAPPEEVHPGQ